MSHASRKTLSGAGDELECLLVTSSIVRCQIGA